MTNGSIEARSGSANSRGGCRDRSSSYDNGDGSGFFESFLLRFGELLARCGCGLLGRSLDLRGTSPGKSSEEPDFGAIKAGTLVES